MAANKYDKEENTEVMHSFFASAISDISAYFRLADTNGSIVTAAVMAILAGIIS